MLRRVRKNLPIPMIIIEIVWWRRFFSCNILNKIGNELTENIVPMYNWYKKILIGIVGLGYNNNINLLDKKYPKRNGIIAPHIAIIEHF